MRKGDEIPWKERDHALFVGFAPVGAPRYVCAVVVEHGGDEGGGGSAVAAPIVRDVLLEVQKRDPARRMPQPDSVAAGAPPTAGAAAADADARAVARLMRWRAFRPISADRELTLADKVRGIQWGLVLLVAVISGIGFAMLYSAANGNLQPWASQPDDAVRDRVRADDRGGADRHPLLVSQRLLDLWRRAAAGRRGRSARRSSAWARSAGSISASSSCSRRKS